MGTTEEVFEHVLDSKIPKNIAKSKRKRKSQLPEGRDRFNPKSDAAMDMFKRKDEEKDEKANSKKPRLVRKSKRNITTQ